MLLLTSTILVLLTIFYLNYALTTSKERKIKESVVYANAENEWQHIQSWYTQKHPQKALPFTMLIDTGSWIGIQMKVYSEKGNISVHETLTPSEFVIAIQKIKKHLQEYGYK